jgi:hypothetical protein
MMKFKTDENMPVEAAEELRQAGHDALSVADQLLAGQPFQPNHSPPQRDVLKARGHGS